MTLAAERRRRAAATDAEPSRVQRPAHRRDCGSPLRVCIVRQSDLYEIPVKREAEALAAAGYEVEVLCMRNPERPRRAVINGVTILSLPAALRRSGKARYALDYLWFFVLAFCTLAARHLRRRYAVVQVNTMPDFLVFAAAAPKLLGARVLLFMKEPTPELAETLFGRGPLVSVLAWLEQRAIRFADHVLTVTEQLKARYVERGADPRRISVVYNGAEPATWGAAPTSGRGREDGGGGGEFLVVCHGSIEERYGQDTIVEAARLLRAELPELRVVFTGRGSYAEELERRIARAGVADIVRFEGWVTFERLRELLERAAVGVVAQKASPYSHLVHTNKMVDYWNFGLPVVASRLRAVASLYDDRVLEYYEPGDPADLARAIRRLHDDPVRRAQLAAAGRQAACRNGWRAQRRVYLDAYRALLRPRRRALTPA